MGKTVIIIYPKTTDNIVTSQDQEIHHLHQIIIPWILEDQERFIQINVNAVSDK